MEVEKNKAIEIYKNDNFLVKTDFSSPNSKKRKKGFKGGEGVCFHCYYSNGELVPCSRKDCQKVYHRVCIGNQNLNLKNWQCSWHICDSCKKAAQYMCYTCHNSLCKMCIKESNSLCKLCFKESNSLCKTCIKESNFLRVNGSKGFCKICIGRVAQCENNERGCQDIFRSYWNAVKSKLRQNERTEIISRFKGSIPLVCKEKPDGRLDDPSNDQVSNSGSSSDSLEEGSSKRRKVRSCTDSSDRTSRNEGISILCDTEWACKELLDFVALIKNGDTSFLSHFDVRAILIEYIKRNNLRDPHHQNQINCDQRLTALFGKACIKHFEMLKYLGSHLLKNDSEAIQARAVERNPSQIKTVDHRKPQREVVENRLGKVCKTSERKSPQAVMNLVNKAQDDAKSDYKRDNCMQQTNIGLHSEELNTHMIEKNSTTVLESSTNMVDIANAFDEKTDEPLLKQDEVQEIPEVHADLDMNPSHKAQDDAKSDDTRQDNYMSQTVIPNGFGERIDEPSWKQNEVEEILEIHADPDSNQVTKAQGDANSDDNKQDNYMTQMDIGIHGVDKKPDTNISMTAVEPSNDFGERTNDPSRKQDEYKNPVVASVLDNGTPKGLVLAGSESTSRSMTACFVRKTDKLWHYEDPSGNIQGPFSMLQLCKWSTTSSFPANMRVWRKKGNPEDSILLTDALNNTFSHPPRVPAINQCNRVHNVIDECDVESPLAASSSVTVKPMEDLNSSGASSNPLRGQLACDPPPTTFLEDLIQVSKTNLSSSQLASSLKANCGDLHALFRADVLDLKMKAENCSSTSLEVDDHDTAEKAYQSVQRMEILHGAGTSCASEPTLPAQLKSLSACDLPQQDVGITYSNNPAFVGECIADIVEDFTDALSNLQRTADCGRGIFASNELTSLSTSPPASSGVEGETILPCDNSVGVSVETQGFVECPQLALDGTLMDINLSKGDLPFANHDNKRTNDNQEWNSLVDNSAREASHDKMSLHVGKLHPGVDEKILHETLSAFGAFMTYPKSVKVDHVAATPAVLRGVADSPSAKSEVNGEQVIHFGSSTNVSIETQGFVEPPPHSALNETSIDSKDSKRDLALASCDKLNNDNQGWNSLVEESSSGAERNDVEFHWDAAVEQNKRAFELFSFQSKNDDGQTWNSLAENSACEATWKTECSFQWRKGCSESDWHGRDNLKHESKSSWIGGGDNLLYNNQRKASLDKTTLYVGNLDDDVDEEVLYNEFCAFGAIIGKPSILRDFMTGNFRFGFITYESVAESRAAMEAMNGRYLRNSKITVTYKKKKDTIKELHGTPTKKPREWGSRQLNDDGWHQVEKRESGGGRGDSYGRGGGGRGYGRGRSTVYRGGGSGFNSGRSGGGVSGRGYRSSYEGGDRHGSVGRCDFNSGVQGGGRGRSSGYGGGCNGDGDSGSLNSGDHDMVANFAISQGTTSQTTLENDPHVVLEVDDLDHQTNSASCSSPRPDANYHDANTVLQSNQLTSFSTLSPGLAKPIDKIIGSCNLLTSSPAVTDEDGVPPSNDLSPKTSFESGVGTSIQDCKTYVINSQDSLVASSAVCQGVAGGPSARYEIDGEKIVPFDSSASVSIETQVFPTNRRLYVGNLDHDVDEKRLHDRFSEFGAIVDLCIRNHCETGNSRFGFITYDSIDTARRALEATNGKYLLWRQMKVGYAKWRPRGTLAEKAPEWENHQLNNDCWHQEDRRDNGEGCSDSYVRGSTGGRGYGDGFDRVGGWGSGRGCSDGHDQDSVPPSNDLSPKSFLENGVGTLIQDCKSDVINTQDCVVASPAVCQGVADGPSARSEIDGEKIVPFDSPAPVSVETQGFSTNTRTLFVGNLDRNVDEKLLRDRFSEFGVVGKATLKRDRETGHSRCFGFITYDSIDTARRAMEATNDQFLLLRRMKVEYAYGEPHGTPTPKAPERGSCQLNYDGRYEEDRRDKGEGHSNGGSGWGYGGGFNSSGGWGSERGYSSSREGVDSYGSRGRGDFNGGDRGRGRGGFDRRGRSSGYGDDGRDSGRWNTSGIPGHGGGKLW